MLAIWHGYCMDIIKVELAFYTKESYVVEINYVCEELLAIQSQK